MDSMITAGRYDDALTEIHPILADAETRNDSVAISWFLVARGRAQLGLGNTNAAAASFDRAIATAETSRDTLDWMTALGFRAMVFSYVRRSDEAVRLNEKRLQLALRTRNALSEAWARAGLGYSALVRGEPDSAKAHFGRATGIFETAGQARAALMARVGLGRALSTTKEIDAARKCYRRVWKTALEIGDRARQADAVNNLGTLEHEYGDMSLAAQYFERARVLQRDAGNVRGMLVAATNVAVSHIYLGQYKDAAAILSNAVQICEEKKLTDLLGMSLLNLAVVRRKQHRNRRAAALCRRVLELGDAINKKHQDEALLGLAGSLSEMDSVSAAIKVLQFALSQDPLPEAKEEITLALSQQLLLDGRPIEALDRARRVAGARDQPRVLAPAAFQMSACLRAAGHRAKALEWFCQGAACLDTVRQLTESHEWRESIAGGCALVNTSAIVLEYPPTAPWRTRIEALFNVIQRFKARTLIERIVEPRKRGATGGEFFTLPEVTLHRLQSDVLRPGDLFLDFAVGDSVSYLFAVTRDSCRLVRLQGTTGDLPERIDLYCKLVGSPVPGHDAGESTALRRMQQALGDAILGGISDLVASAARLVVAPDGFFSAIPFGTLSPTRATSPDTPLLASMEVWEVPSARILTYLRQESPGDHGQATIGSVLAVAPATNGELPGAALEVRWLSRRFANVEVAEGPMTKTIFANAMLNCDIIHVAAHVEVDDERPWHSGILVGARPVGQTPGARESMDGPPDDRATEIGTPRRTSAVTGIQSDTYLRAGDIADLYIPARLAVLSGCSSALGRVTSGEGVLGLTSAFLSAGVPVVIATLWPVDDDVTADLMKAFYARLAAGDMAGTALCQAQRTIRGHPTTRRPFYWAGFVAVGDGNITVRLEDTRGGHRGAYLIMLLAVMLFLAGAWLGRRGVFRKKVRFWV